MYQLIAKTGLSNENLPFGSHPVWAFLLYYEQRLVLRVDAARMLDTS